MKRILMLAMAALGLTFGAKAECPDGYTKLSDGNYSFKVDDEHATDGKWYIKGEFQPVDGAEINGADWYVDNLVAFQGDGGVLNLKTGTLVWTGTAHGGGVWPDNNSKYLNFVPGSTFVCMNPNIPLTGDMSCFNKCFKDQWSNFRYNHERITTEERFNELFVLEAYGENGSKFYLKPSNDVYFNTLFVQSVESNDKVKLSATFLNEGDGTAAITAAWGAADMGESLSAWSNTSSLGTLAQFLAAGGTISGLTEGVTYSIRLFATTTDGAVTVSACEQATLYNKELIHGTINRWKGGEGLYNEATNWSLGHVPTASEVRWVDSGVIDCGSGNNFSPNPQDMLIGGKIVSRELVLVKPGIDLKGTTFEFEVFSMNNFSGGADFSAGAAIVKDPRVEGFWRANDSLYVNVPVNSTASFTVPFNVTGTYNNFIANGKVRDDGAVISKADFENEEKWTVTAIADNKTSFKRTVKVEGAPVLETLQLALDPASDTTVDAQISFTSASALTSAVIKYGTDLGNLSHSVALEGAALNPQDNILRFEISGLTRKSKYYFIVVAENSAASIESSAKGIVAYVPVSPAAVWIGTNSADASDPGNWSPAQVPTAASEVEVYDTMAVRQSLNWNLANGVKSWTQRSFENGSVRVTLQTTATDAFTVSGDMVVESGVWGVPRNNAAGAQPTSVFNVQVGGNLTIGSGVSFHAGQGRNSDTGAGSGWYRGKVDGVWVGGPGYVDIGGEDLEHWPLYGRGASFGGDGGYRTLDFVLKNNDNPETPEDESVPDYAVPAYTLPLTFTSYGKILDPMDWGSSGHGDNPNFAGGGIVKLDIGGQFTLNGKLESVGFGYPGLNNNDNHNGTAGASSGGTINVTAGTLAGNGTINADGGCDELGGNGSGGRIRVKLKGTDATFADNAINMHAKGGMFRDGGYMGPRLDLVDAAAGTIALQTAADSATSGTVILRNEIRQINGTPVPVGATHFPAMTGNDGEKLSGVRLVVEADTFVKITKDVTVAALTFEGAAVKRGTYTAAQLNTAVGKEMFSGAGSLTIGNKGFAVLIR